MNQTEKLPPLEAGLLGAMQALDSQISREMQRSPKEVEEKGVLKWEPFQTRIERVAAFAIESIGTQSAELDSLLVLAQAFTKALYLVTQDLEQEGLKKVRSGYCEAAFEKILKDAESGLKIVQGKMEMT